MKVRNSIRESDRIIMQNYFPRTWSCPEELFFNFSYSHRVEGTERTTAIFRIKKKKK